MGRLGRRTAGWGVRDLQELDFDLSLTGFDAKQIDDILLDAMLDEDDLPPLPADPVTRAGDVWLLGPHRVLCGDATDPATVAQLP